jgi:hypothetical protein
MDFGDRFKIRRLGGMTMEAKPQAIGVPRDLPTACGLAHLSKNFYIAQSRLPTSRGAADIDPAFPAELFGDSQGIFPAAFAILLDPHE